jgi:tetratricopeptide (TPR) repeat protein
LRSEPQSQARLMAVIGRVYLSLGLIDPAERLLTSALRVREASGNGNDLQTADALTDLVKVFLARGEMRRVGEFASRAHAMRERLLPAGDSRLALGLYFLGVVSMYSDDVRAARERYDLALKLVENHSDLDMLRMWIYNDLGILEWADGRYPQGRAWLERAEDLGRRVLPEDDPERLFRANALGFGLLLEGRLDEARRYLAPAAAGIERVYGPKHALTATVLQSMGELERRSGRYASSHEFLQRAIAAAHGAGDLAPSSTATMLTSLALLASDEGRLEEAARLFTEVLADRERIMGRDSREAADALEGLAGVLRRSGQEDRAAQVDARAREIRAVRGSGPGTRTYLAPATSGGGRDETTPVSNP